MAGNISRICHFKTITDQLQSLPATDHSSYSRLSQPGTGPPTLNPQNSSGATFALHWPKPESYKKASCPLPKLAPALRFPEGMRQCCCNKQQNFLCRLQHPQNLITTLINSTSRFLSSFLSSLIEKYKSIKYKSQRTGASLFNDSVAPPCRMIQVKCSTFDTTSR